MYYFISYPWRVHGVLPAVLTPAAITTIDISLLLTIYYSAATTIATITTSTATSTGWRHTEVDGCGDAVGAGGRGRQTAIGPRGPGTQGLGGGREDI